MIPPQPGAFLISDPFLKDPNFMRSVVFLCEHDAEGSFGLVMNRPNPLLLDDYLPELKGAAIPLYYGGPVAPDTLHILHRFPAQIPGGQEVVPGVFWGGDLKKIINVVKSGGLMVAGFRFFLGYSGWSAGQLAEEMEEKAWLTILGNQSLVFHDNPQRLWKDSILQMEEKFHPIMHYPIDPQLN